MAETAHSLRWQLSGCRPLAGNRTRAATKAHLTPSSLQKPNGQGTGYARVMATKGSDLGLTRLTLEIADGVATITLNRVEVHNAFDPAMTNELARVWQALRTDDDVRAVVLTGAGDKAFCSGFDRSTGDPLVLDPFTYEDPGKFLGPKSQGFWKPVVAAVNGIACGGAFYLLGESDVILAAEHATFFDPHVTFSMVAVFEPLLMLRRMPFGEVLRMTLAGAHERVSASTAREMGLVSEVLPGGELLDGAQALAGIFASQPPLAIQSTLRTLWAAKDLPGIQAASLGNLFLQLGTTTEALVEGQRLFEAGVRVKPRIR
jgi:enoyl-CoA hydratase/carnithine racemase